MCYCEGIEYFISNVFRVLHFADGPLRQRIEINVFCTERRKACFEENTLVACLLHHYEWKKASFVP